MIPLTAREALGPQVERVTAIMRLSELEDRERESGLYAVFGEEDGAFLGLVTEHACARFPNRIFADLLAGSRPAPVAAEIPIEAVYHRMAAEGVEALPVLDENGAFLGVITRPSLLEALLRRERELLADAQWLQGQLEAEQKRLVAWSKRQEQLNQASRALLGLVGRTNLERKLLQEAIQALATLLQARYGAIGILDEADGTQQFIFTGLTAEEVDRIGEHPRGRGLLGVIIREDQILRLEDLAQDPRHAGFPPYHPPMKTLLAVPISHQRAVYGRVYLCDKTTGEPFTGDDECLAVSFARSLALALAHARELAERERAEKALQASELWLRAIFNSQDDVVLVVTPDRIVLDMNMAAQRVFGYSVEEVKNRSTEILHVDRQHYVEFGERIQAAFARGEVARFEFQAKRINGEIFPTEHTVSLLKKHLGEPIGIVSVVRDITERKRAEEERAAIALRDEALVKALGQIIYDWKPPANELIWDGDYRKILGYTREEMGNNTESWTSRIHPEDLNKVLEEVESATREQRHYDLDYRFRHRDGSYKWMHDSGVLFINAAGELDRIIGVFSDITARKRMEEALRESETRYRALYQDVPSMYFTISPDGTILSVNQFGAEQLGYTVEELAGRSISDVVHRDDFKTVRGHLTACFEDPMHVAHWDFHKVRRDGSLLWVEEVARAVPSGDGTPVCLVVCRDITERKQAEEALRATGNRLHLAMQAAHMGAWEWDLVNNRVTYSDELGPIFGLPQGSQHPTREAFLNAVHPADRDRVARATVQTFDGAGDFQDEFRVLWPDGSVHWVANRGMVLRDSTRKPVNVTGVLMDVTDRKRAEEAVRTSQKRLRDLIDGLGPQMFVGLMTPDGTLIEANQPALAAAGLKPEDVLGKSVEETYWWANSEEVQQQLRGAIERAARGEASRYDVQVRVGDNQFIIIDFSLQPLRDETGKVVFLVPSAIVITERKRAEEALRGSEERLRLALDAADMGTFDWDMVSGRIIWSAGHERLFGFAPGTFGGRYQDFEERVHPEDLPRMNEVVARCIAARTPFAHEFRVVWPDGSVHWVAGQGEFEFSDAGQAVRMRGVVLEVTERKLAERSIEHSRALLQSFVEHTPAAVAMFDTSLRYVAVSRRWLHDYRLGDQNLVGRHHYEVFPEIGKWKEWQEVHQRCLAGAVERRDEDRFVRQDGSEDWLRWEVRPWYDVSGEVGGIIMFTEVINERKRAEEERDRLFEQVRAGRERLKILSRRLVAVQEEERRQLARELHDEIGQILTGIKLSLEMSTRVPADGVSSALSDARGLVNDLMARVRTLSLDLRPAMLDDLGLVPTLLWHFERYTAQTGVRVTFTHHGLVGRLAPEVETNIYRIVQEALTNVARHAGVQEAVVTLCAGEGLLGVQVQDQGVGFLSEAAVAVGASIGLAGMYERAELLGGRLTVQSAPGAGTTVSATIPLARAVERRRSHREP